MKKLLTLLAILIAFNAYSQNTTSPPTSPATKGFNPSFSWWSPLGPIICATDSLKQFWMQGQGGNNRFYSATEIGVKYYPKSKLYPKSHIDSLIAGLITFSNIRVSGILVGPAAYLGRVSIDSLAGTYRNLLYTSNGSLRWSLSTDNSPETGGNAGSNFLFSSWADVNNAETVLHNIFAVNRASGVLNFLTAPTILGNQVETTNNKITTLDNSTTHYTTGKAVTDAIATSSSAQTLQAVTTNGATTTNPITINNSYASYVSAVTGINVFGTSYDKPGYGASDPSTTSVIPLLKKATGWTINNMAASGDVIYGGQASKIYYTPVYSNTLTYFDLGYNESFYLGGDTAKITLCKKMHLATTAYLSIQDSKKVLAKNMTLSGAWFNGNYFISKAVAQSGATATTTVTGTTIIVCPEVLDGGTATFTVTIDGVVRGTYTNTTSATTFSPYSYAPSALTYTGLSSGSHTVVVTTTNTGTFYLDWVAGIDGTTPGPYTYVSNIPYNFSVADAVTDAYNSYITSNVSFLSGLGLHTVLVDVNSVINPATDINAGTPHPNDLGYSKIAAKILATIPSTFYNRNSAIDSLTANNPVASWSYLRNYNAGASASVGVQMQNDTYAVGSIDFTSSTNTLNPSSLRLKSDGDILFSNTSAPNAYSPVSLLLRGGQAYFPGLTTTGPAHINGTDGSMSSSLIVNNDIAAGTINLTQKVTSILPVANGGTSYASYTIGDMLQASATGTLSKLASVATGNVLISGGVGTVSSWGKVGLTTHVSGILGSTNGGSGVNNSGTLTWGTGGTLGTNAYTSTAYEPQQSGTGFVKKSGTTTSYDNSTYLTTAVTSITPGYGFTSSTPITTTGTLTIDSTKNQTVLNFFPKGDTRYQKTLVSGTNIKTINSATILGSGNINLQTPLVANTDYLPVANPTSTGTATIGPVVIAAQTTYGSGTNIYLTYAAAGGAAYPFLGNGGLILEPRPNGSDIILATGSTTVKPRLYVSGLSGNVNIGYHTGTDAKANLAVGQSTLGNGLITTTATGTTVSGSGTQFTNTFKVGDVIIANGETRTISAIASDVSMTTDAWTNANTAIAYTLTGGDRFKVYGYGAIYVPVVGASKVVFTDANSNLTPVGIGTSSQFIMGNGSTTTALPSGTTATTQSPGTNNTTIATMAALFAERTNTATVTGKTLAVGSNNITSTANRAAQYNASTGNLEASSVTNTELGYVSGVTSAIQTQINAKGTGTVTSVTGSNGVGVATGTTTPVISLGNITPTTINTTLLPANIYQTPAGTVSTDSVVVKNGSTGKLAAVSTVGYLKPTGSASLLTGFPTLNQNTTGSAAKLTTARNINGVSFDGTSDITISNGTQTVVQQFSGDGTTTVFSLAYDLTSIPQNVIWTPTSAAAMGSYWIDMATATSTNVNIHFAVAPTTGTNNITGTITVIE